MSTATEIKVGDELAFNVGYGKGVWDILKVSKITKTGRIVCGTGEGESQYTLDPDLRVRGRHSYSGPYRGEPVTDEIREQVFRQSAVSRLYNRQWSAFTTDQLRRIVAILDEVR
jgi:hypothetical protein